MSVTKHKPGSFLGSLLGIIGFSAVAGVLVSATMTPALAVSSSAANSGFDLFESLPSYATISEQVERNRIYAQQDGQPIEIAQFYSQNREAVSLSQVNNHVLNALVAGEDQRFYEHGGVDAQSLARAVLSQLGVGSSTGGSTLTMQLVRQQIAMDAYMRGDTETYESQYEESYARKLKEMKLSIGLENLYTKDEILLAYLNIAFFGDNVYGIQTAAQRMFGVDASALNPAQAASLVAIAQWPTARTLFNSGNYEANQVRRDYILQSMHNQGYLTEEEYNEAVGTPIDENYVNIQPARNGCMAGHESARFFCDYVQHVLKKDTVGGNHILAPSPEDNDQALRSGGYDIYTSLDVGLNDEVQSSLDNYTPNTETAWRSGSAVTMLEVTTGRILAMAQNKDFDNTDSSPATATGVNFNTDFPYGGSSGFQPGSGYKIFTLAQWLEDGKPVNEVLDASRKPRQLSGSSCGVGGSYDPQNNLGRQYNRASVTDIFINSMNTGVIEMASKLDLCDIRDTASRMGVQPAANPDEPLLAYPSSLIGSGSEVSPMSMAEAFQTIANGGQHCEPRAIDRIVDREGNEVSVPPQDCETAIPLQTAAGMQHVLQAVTRGNPINNPGAGVPVISKTGTNDNVAQTWVNGASPTVATSVWVGNISGQYSLQSRWDIRSYIFTEAMRAAIARYPGGEWTQPDQETLMGDMVPLPDVVGMEQAEARALLEAQGFKVTIGSPVGSARPEGQIESTAPGAGAAVSPGGSVTIYPSNGVDPNAVAELSWPNLVGTPLAEARGALSGAGFNPDNAQISWHSGPPGQECRVLAQNPAAGTPGGADDPISLVLSGDRDGNAVDC